MAAGKLFTVVQQLRCVLNPGAAAAADESLLESFLKQRDEAAFEALVRRHGPMVLGVCRRILGNFHDAEDAFQATFLVLVRRAASIRPRSMVGNWLYGVACRTALNARRTTAKRRAKEAVVLARTQPSDQQRADLRAVLDEELQRLPPKCRAVVILSDLEGKTRKEVALQLGWPEGSVASRLARARARLAKRLARYGLAVSGASVGAFLSEGVASACVPNPLVVSTVKAASLLAAGQAASGVIPVPVAALVKGALQAMLLNNVLKTTALLTLIVAVFGTGTALVLSYAGETEQQGKPAIPAPPTAFEGKRMSSAVAQGGDAAKKFDLSKELEKLKGVWVCVGYERDGQEHVDQQAKEAMWNETLWFHMGPDSVARLKGHWLNMSWETKSPGRQTAALAEFKLIPTMHRAIDLTWKSVPTRDFMPRGIDPAWEQATWNETTLDRAQPGVYSIEGDRLRLCWGELGGERPASLKTKRGDKRTVHLYVKKDSPAPDGKGKKQGEKEPADLNDKEKATDTVIRPVVILIAVKTKGIPEGAKIKEIDAPKKTVAKKALHGVKDGTGRKRGLDREYAVKSVKITLADDTAVECQILLTADEPDRTVIKNIQGARQLLEATSDARAGKWALYIGEYKIAIDTSKDRPARQRDMKMLQGPWRVVSSAMVASGHAAKQPENEVRKHKVLVSGDKLTYEFHNEQNDRHEGTILLDPKRNWVDWTQTAGGKRIGTMLGIYEIKGDEVRLLFGVDGIVRPRAFDEVGWLLVLKREKLKTEGNRPLPPVDTGKERATLTERTDWITSVAFSPDGKLQASSSRHSLAANRWHGTVKLWEVATSK